MYTGVHVYIGRIEVKPEFVVDECQLYGIPAVAGEIISVMLMGNKEMKAALEVFEQHSPSSAFPTVSVAFTPFFTATTVHQSRPHL
jgi:hypothetical protein